MQQSSEPANNKVEIDRRTLVEARQKGKGALFGAFVKLSGPGWLQSAITLGGGSLAASLYLGVLGGYNLLWLQLLAMLFGVILLSAIAYVTLSTGERPFHAINKHINPVLGWGWALASLAANLVWCLPQFSLGTGAVQQNLLGMTGDEGKIWIAGGILVIAVIVIWFYDSGGWGVRIFEILLKILVGIVVVSFFAVIIAMSLRGTLPWGRIFAGYVPDFSLLFRPSSTFDTILAQTGEFKEFWSQYILGEQRDVIVAAAATAVGINMTFLLPYSMLRKGWNRDFRGLAIFDLSTGLLVPFVLATSCVVIASAARFHTEYHPALVGEEYDRTEYPFDASNLEGGYRDILNQRVQHATDPQRWSQLESTQQEFEEANPDTEQPGPLGEYLAQQREAVPLAEKKLAAMLVRRDSMELSASLAPLTTKTIADYVFGLGVVGMALSTIVILMLINGFVFCEIFNLPQAGVYHRIGSFLPAAVGVTGPFIWSDAAPYLAVPTSVFGFVLIPIAYVTFFLMLNQKSLLGESRPRGGVRIVWNIVLLVGIALVTIGSVFQIHDKTGWYGIAGLVAFVLLVLIVQFTRKKPLTP